jgi:microcystin degradation protein MlrC
MRKEKRVRIAVGQISSESNHFVSSPCELNLFFNTGYVLEGNDVFKLQATGTELGGILASLKKAVDIEVVPLLAARAVSSGPLSETCYSYLREHLLAPLKHASPVDGVILSHHGSMAAVNEDDAEGDIAQAVREIIGPAVPFVMTLDLHGNVTKRMVEATSAILGYEHYPHDDAYETGVRGSRLLLETVRDKVRPIIGHVKLPMLLTAFNASTAWDTPFAQLMRQAKDLELRPGILSTSLFFVGSYIDVPDMGCSTLVVTDGDASRAVKEARILAESFWAQRRDFGVTTYSVAEAVEQGRKVAGGPILLLDTADTTGGGASGDSVGLIKGLLDIGVTERCLTMVVDPEAAEACAKAGLGCEITVQLGHKLDPAWGKPITARGRVLWISDGRFQYTGGIHGGTWASMGRSAVIEVGSIQILIATYPTYDWADEQYRSMGMNPAGAKFVEIKNMMNFRFGYRDIMKGFFVLDLRGPTPPDMRMLSFKRATRPLFPLDEDISRPEMRISTSK